MALLYLALGLAGLSFGSDLAVRGSVAVAHRFRWPTWITGLVLLALGTSLPELFVSAVSAPEHPGLATANIFGSNGFNAFVVLGVILTLKGEQRLHATAVRRATLIPLTLGSIAAFSLLVVPLEAYRWGTLFLIGYLWMILASVRGREAEAEEELAAAPEWGFPRASAATLAGFVLLAVAAKSFLEGALGVAMWFGWSDGFVGFLLAAVGTSAPELFTSVRALRLGHVRAVFGNVVGSNAFNLLLAGGVVSLLARTEVPKVDLAPQLWTNALATFVLLLPALVTGRRRIVMPRVFATCGFLLVLLYLGSVWWVYSAGQAA